MSPLPLLPFVQGLCLASFALAARQLVALRFTPALGLAALAVVAGGVAWGRGRLPADSTARDPARDSARRTLVGALAALGALFAGWAVPADATAAAAAGFLVLVALLGAVGAAAAAGTDGGRASGVPAGVAWLAGATVGILLSAPLLDGVGGAFRAGWLAAAGLALVAVAGARRDPRVWAGALLVWVPVVGLLLGGPGGLPLRRADLARFATAGPGAPDSALAHVATAWDAAGRTDVLSRGDAVSWLLTDGRCPVPVATEGAPPLTAARWVERVPLLGLPLLCVEPERVASAGPLPGPVAEIVAALGAGAAECWSTSPTGRRWLGERAAGPALTTRDPRRALTGGGARHDLLVLTSRHLDPSRWPGHGAGESRSWTVEAFRSYWASLRPGGWLAVTTADERLFVRAVLTAWAASARGEPEPLAARAWGVRLRRDAPHLSPYRFLLFVRREPIDSPNVARFAQVASALPVTVLFGPGIAPRGHWAPLVDARTPDAAGERLGLALSRLGGAWLDVAPATDDAGSFFRLARDLCPETKSLLGACVLAAVALILVPLSGRRRLDAPEADRLPPLPVLLAPFLLLGVALGTGVAGAVQRVWALAGPDPTHTLPLLAGAAIGCAGGLGGIRGARAAAALLVVAAALALALPRALDAVLGPALLPAAPLRIAVAGGGAVLLCLTITLSLGAAARRLERELPELLPSAWALCGVSVAGGVPLLAWVELQGGWGAVPLVPVLGCLLAGGALLWRASAGRAQSERM